MWRLRCRANLRQLWPISCASQRMGGEKRNVWRETTLTLITAVPALPCCSLLCAYVSARVSLCTYVRPPAPLCERVFCVCVCVCLHRCAYAVGGCEAVQSPGRTEWIYKLMEFKASSIDYHYNKQQHTECLIIFRQRFCALSSYSADAVTLSDICLWLQLDGIQKEKEYPICISPPPLPISFLFNLCCPSPVHTIVILTQSTSLRHLGSFFFTVVNIFHPCAVFVKGKKIAYHYRCNQDKRGLMNQCQIYSNIIH